jgi:hypothetical protein
LRFPDHRREKKTLKKELIALVLLAGMSFPSHAEWRERRAALSEMHKVGEFRIFYSLAGSDALPDISDSNRNGTPDYVDRLARELTVARDWYDQEVRLKHPLRSPRYQNRAEFIDVNLLKFPLSTNGPKHGVAYDELSSFDRSKDFGRKVAVLVIDMSNSLSSKNPTAAHELFHLYQNGYTFFKNRWYTEGTARWAEELGKNSRGGVGQWPRSSSALHALFRQTYDAAHFWNSVAFKMDPAGGGRAFIKTFLEELDRMDDAARAKNIHASEKWSEKDQFSGLNDAYIWEALRNTLRKPEFSARSDQDIEGLMKIRP